MSGLRRSYLAGAFCALAALAAGTPARAADPDGDPELRDVRAAAAHDAQGAHLRLAALRQAAMARGQLARRLAFDELDCRLLQDIDKPQALAVAQQGAAILAASGHPDRASVLAGYRLAACSAGAQLDLGQVSEGQAQLERILAATAQDPGLAPAQALALLERGVAQSRGGALVAGQSDLLAACSTLDAWKLAADAELCHWHLAGHYKRSGDYQEAIRLIEPLLTAARTRNALADISVYAYGLAQVMIAAGQQRQALEPLQESLAAAGALRDAVGMSYAEAELGRTLLALGKDAEALPHARRAVEILPRGVYDVEFLLASITYAKTLNHLRQPARALAVLEDARPVLERLQRESYRADWLAERADALARTEHWAAAYESLESRQRIVEHLDRERLSEQSARLRAEYNRGRDLASLEELNKANAQSERLLRVEAVAITLAALLLAATAVFAARKMRQSRALHRLAMIDELTGLPNRRAVRQRLRDLFSLARQVDHPLAVLMIDIDRFKAVNDTHGHAVGDEVLRHLGALLAAGLRRDDWVGRLGGEEFLAVLPNAALAQASDIAERMCRIARATPCRSTAGVLEISVSIGVAVLDAAMPDIDALVEQADAMLYEAKRRGRDQVVGAAPAALSPPDGATAGLHRLGPPAGQLAG